jgi:predicted Zn-dependent protease
VLVAAGRDREAEALAAELPPEERRAIDESIGEVRAARLREEAKRLQAQGRAADAVAALEKVAALEPQDPWVRLDLARLYAARGERERGQALFQELIARRPRDATRATRSPSISPASSAMPRRCRRSRRSRRLSAAPT